MPVQQFPMRLDGNGHAGRNIVAAEQPANFITNAGPGRCRPASGYPGLPSRLRRGTRYSGSAAVQPQAFGNGEHDLAMRHGRTNIFGHVQRGDERPLLVARRAGATLLAGEGHEHLVLAVAAADAGEAFVQVAALQKRGHAALDDRPPETILGLIPLVVDLHEGREMAVQQSPQVGGVRIAGTVQRRRLGGRDHDGKSGRAIVYTLSLEHPYRIRQPRVDAQKSNGLRPWRLRREDRLPARSADVEKLFADSNNKALTPCPLPEGSINPCRRRREWCRSCPRRRPHRASRGRRRR